MRIMKKKMEITVMVEPGRPLPPAAANIPSLITIQVHAAVVMMMVLATVKLSFIAVNIVDIVLCRFGFFILLSSKP